MRFDLLVDGKVHNVELGIGSMVTVRVDGEMFQAEVTRDGNIMDIQLNGRSYRARLEEQQIMVDGRLHGVEVRNLRRGKPSWYSDTAMTDSLAAGGEEIIYPPMPGSVVAIKVKEGDVVEPGDSILVLEAMKMQNEIHSSRGGVVREIRVAEGDLVGAGDVMIVIGD